MERKLNELTDQLGTLVLDMLLVELKRLNTESEIFQEFEMPELPLATGLFLYKGDATGAAIVGAPVVVKIMLKF